MLSTTDSLYLRKHTDWKWGDGKIFYAHCNKKKGRGDYIYIRQNGL